MMLVPSWWQSYGLPEVATGEFTVDGFKATWSCDLRKIHCQGSESHFKAVIAVFDRINSRSVFEYEFRPESGVLFERAGNNSQFKGMAHEVEKCCEKSIHESIRTLTE